MDSPYGQKSTQPCSDLPPSNQAVILHHGLSVDQATTLLGWTIQLLEWGQAGGPRDA